jgi:urease accessory protein UreF
VLEAHHALNVAPGDAWFARTAHRCTVPWRGDALAACAHEELACSAAAVQRRASADAGRGLLRAARGVTGEGDEPALARVAGALGDVTPRATVFGSVAAVWGIAEEQAVEAYAYTALAALVDAAVRLGAVPPLRGQRILRDVLGGGPAPSPRAAGPAYCSPLLDIALMGHETDDARHFAS